MTLRQIVLVGDSLTQGTGPTGETACISLGGKGAWWELVAERLANLTDVGPLISPGLRMMTLGILASGDGEWSTAGTWTVTASTDAWDKGPYGHSYRGTTSTDIATFTKPSRWRSIVGFAVDYVDYTSGGNWQYQIDGGTWTNMGQTLAHDNNYKRFYVASSVTSTVAFRGYNGTTNVGCCLIGITPYYTAPQGVTQGLIVHNLGVNGQRINNLCATTSGDRLAFFRSVTLQGGSPIAHTPNAGVTAMFINDVAIGNTTTWATDITTLNTAVSSLGPFSMMSPWEASTAAFNQTQQTNYRAQTATTTASLSAKTYDLYNAWSSLGFTANAGAVASGFLVADATHESQAGHLDLAERLYWYVRNQLLALGTVTTTWPVKAKPTAVAYSAKASTVAYAATTPVSLGT